jgi:hypothetical protein
VRPCIPKFLIDKFKQSLKDGTIDPKKMEKMSSEKRREFLGKHVGENNAEWVNAEFESKLILKNVQEGMVTWAKTLTGIKPEVRRDILAKIEKMQAKDILDPKSAQEFKADLVAHRLGTAVTMAEAADISSLAKSATQAKAAMDKSVRRKPGESATPEEMAYGQAWVKLRNYRNDLVDAVGKQSLREVLSDPRKYWSNFVKLAAQSKSLKAAMDISALLRQGFNTLKTRPSIWAKNTLKTFKDIKSTLGGDKEVMDMIDADIFSDPLYPQMMKAKLSVGVHEEAYPTSVAEKIPVIGKLYKTSDVAYNGFMRRLRVDLFKHHLKVMEKNGIDIEDPVQLESVGKMVNAITGRGHLGSWEPGANAMNALFFAPRFVKSQFDVLTAHTFQKGVTPYVRKQAAVNLVKIVTTTAAMLGVAKAVDPDSVDFDPRSADFGKIKAGGYTFDMTGGMGSLITLAVRVLPALIGKGTTKSSTTGIVKPLSDGGYGANAKDVFYNFVEGKMSPVPALVRDMMDQETFEGEKPGFMNSLASLTVPITLSNIPKNFSEPNKAMALLALIADAVGLNATNKNLNAEKTVSSKNAVEREVKRLEKIGDDKGAVALEERNKKILEEGDEIESAVKEVKGLEKEIKDIEADLTIPEDEKKKELDALKKDLKVAEEEVKTQFKKIRAK